MGTVPSLLKQRWSSTYLVGDASHACIVRIRQGYMFHQYQATTILATSPEQVNGFPTIWKGNNSQPWQGQWIVTGDWITLSNIESANYTRDLTDNSGSGNDGGSVLTVVIDNIAFNDQTGLSGLYHSIDRGWFSPTRGVPVNGRPVLWPENEWGDVLNAGYQIELWEGYGVGDDIALTLDGGTQEWSAPALSRTWVGWLDECDLDSDPDHITLTCRDGTILLTDQRLMGENKAKEIQSPITFADRRKTLGEKKEFGNMVVSSGQATADSIRGAQWLSGTHTGPSHTEWIEIHLPAGFYEDFYTDMAFTGETMYISLKAAGGSCKMDGSPLADGWVDLSLGTVPTDGEPYIAKHENTVAFPSRRWSLGGHKFTLGDDSVLRLSFNDLVVDPSVGKYRAGVNAFYAFRYGTDPQKVTGVKAKGWILVDDAADIVRMILLWAGFHEMNVQNFGWTIDQPMVFGQDAFLIDVITEIQQQGNFIFFVDAPTDHDMSLGVPVFQQQSATSSPARGMQNIRDQDLLEAVSVKEDKSNLPYVLRYRGAQSSKGTTLFEDLTKRWTGTYWPPWSGHDYTNLQGNDFSGTFPLERLGGVRRQFSQTNPMLNSVAECLFACILATIQYALQAVTATFQIPGLPSLTLNQQVGLVDEGTGTNSRLWISSIDSTHTLGPNGSWHMTIGGAMVDTEDMNLIADDYQFTYERYVVSKGPS